MLGFVCSYSHSVGFSKKSSSKIHFSFGLDLEPTIPRAASLTTSRSHVIGRKGS